MVTHRGRARVLGMFFVVLLAVFLVIACTGEQNGGNPDTDPASSPRNPPATPADPISSGQQPGSPHPWTPEEMATAQPYPMPQASGTNPPSAASNLTPQGPAIQQPGSQSEIPVKPSNPPATSTAPISSGQQPDSPDSWTPGEMATAQPYPMPHASGSNPQPVVPYSTAEGPAPQKEDGRPGIPAPSPRNPPATPADPISSGQQPGSPHPWTPEEMATAQPYPMPQASGTNHPPAASNLTPQGPAMQQPGGRPSPP
jgi:hypothetical protein